MLGAYQALLGQLARVLALDPADLLQGQELVIDGHSVGLMYDGDDLVGDLVLFCELGVPDASRKAEIHEALLHANCLWVGTSGGTLGVHPESGAVLLGLRYPVDGSTADDLVQVLRIYMDVADHWRAFVGGLVPADVAQPMTDDGHLPVEALMLVA